MIMIVRISVLRSVKWKYLLVTPNAMLLSRYQKVNRPPLNLAIGPSGGLARRYNPGNSRHA